MAKNKSQHFVPQHYLRQFRIEQTKQISVATINPFQLVEAAGISGQCQQDYFYREDGELDELLRQCEDDLAPVLVRVAHNRCFDSKELVALRFLAVILKIRTKKSAEIAKVFPKKVAYEVIESGIERGRLPAPSGGWTEDMMDFTGVIGVELKTAAIPCWLEMQTLACKLLEADETAAFITSDNPVAMLNELFAAAEPHRSFVGFSRSGFQLLLPISPRVSLFFYDPKVYKVGGRRQKLVLLSKSDTELVNSLQVQSAFECLYFHTPSLGAEVRRLVSRYAPLRIPARDSLRELPGRNAGESFIHIRQPSVKLREPWRFCRLRKHPTVGPNNRRDASWSSFVSAVGADMDAHPGRGVFESMEQILGHRFRERA